MINRKALLAVGAGAALAALWPSGTFAADPCQHGADVDGLALGHEDLRDEARCR